MYQNRQKEANARWREKNKERLKQLDREKYLRNREKILQEAKEKNLEKLRQQPTEPKVVEVKPPREYKFTEVMKVLRKDLRHRLWGICVKQWNDNDWKQYNELKQVST